MKFNLSTIFIYVIQFIYVLSDNIPPTLIEYGYDANAGILNFTFSKDVNVSTFRLEYLNAQSQKDITASATGQITSFIPQSINSIAYSNSVQTLVNISVTLSTDNLKYIALQSNLWRIRGSTFLSAVQPFIKDIYGNNVTLSNLNTYAALQAIRYIRDVTPPSLLSWNLNFNNGTIDLYFTKVVAATTLNITAISLLNYNSQTNNGMQYNQTSIRLQTGYLYIISQTQGYSDWIQINSTNIQFNTFKAIPGFGRSMNNTYLAIDDGAVTDTSFFPLVYDGSRTATLQNPTIVSVLVQDTIPPVIDQAILNMSSQQLILIFTEVVNVNTLLTQSITLQSTLTRTSYDPIQILPFTSDMSLNITNTITDTVGIILTPVLYNTMKISNLRLGRDRNSTYITTTNNNWIYDTASPSNGADVISVLSGYPLTQYYPDMVPPQLISWYLNMTSNTFTLTLSEPLDSTTVKPQMILLQSNAIITKSTTSYQLTNTSRLLSSQANIIVIQISDSDANSIKSTPNLCTSTTNCYLSFTHLFAKDTPTYDDKQVVYQNSILPTLSLPPNNYIGDVISPYLIAFNLDMNKRYLNLTFNEPVILTHPSGLTFVTDTLNSNPISLSDQNIVLGYGLQNITIILTQKDYIRLKMNTKSLSSALSTFLVIANYTCTDMSGNTVAGILVDNLYLSPLLPVKQYITDSTPPSISAFHLNTTTNILDIYFNDVLYIQNPLIDIILSGFILVSNVGASSPLTQAKVLTTYNSGNLHINTQPLYTHLNQLNLGFSQIGTFLYISLKNAVKDIPNKNPISPILSIRPIRDGNNVLSYRLNMNDSLLWIEMAYPIYSISILSIKISIYTPSDGFYYNFTSLSNYTIIEDTYITIPIPPVDYHGIQSALNITSADSILLSLGAKSFQDEIGFYLSSASIINCLQLIRDTIPPTLTSYYADMNAGILSMTFSEPIIVNSLVLKSIYLTDNITSSINGTLSRIVSLKNATILTTFKAASTVLININTEGYPNTRDQIYITNAIGKSVHSMYLYTSYDVAMDTAFPPNYLTPIGPSSPLQVSDINLDTTLPALVSFDLDLTVLTLTMNFTKAVDPLTNVPSNYVLVNDPTNPQAIQVSLNYANTSLPDCYGHTIVITLSTKDIDALMLLAPNICTDRSNCYLRIKYGALQDTSPSQNIVQPINLKLAMAPRKFTPNLTPPNLLAFDINFQIGYAIFYLDKYLNCSATDVTNIIFQYQPFLGTSYLYYQLTPSFIPICTPYLSKSIRINFGILNLLILKSYNSLLKTKATSYARLNSPAFYDIFGNANAYVFDGLAIPCTNYVPNTIPPSVYSYTVNNQQQLTLFFTQPIDPTTLKLTNIYFQNAYQNPTFIYNLTIAKQYFISTLRTQIKVQLLNDYNQITAASSIFRFQFTSYMGANSQLVKDMCGNVMIPIDPLSPLMIGPSLSAWDLDMSVGKITLYFTENVNNTITLSGIAIQSAPSVPCISYRFTTAATLLSLGNSQSIYYTYLSAEDITQLQYTALSYSSAGNAFFENSYISIPYGATASTFSGSVIPKLQLTPLRNTSAFPIRIYTPDTVLPDILHYDFVFNPPESLILNFNKPVLPNTLLVTRLFLTTETLGQNISLTATGSVRNVDVFNDTGLQIFLSHYDAAHLKDIMSIHQTVLDWLFLISNGVYDFFGNGYKGNYDSNPVLLRDYTADTTPPYIQRSVLDLNQGLLILTYNEPIDLHTIDATDIYISGNNSITLQSDNTLLLTDNILQLSNYSIIDWDPAYNLVINLDLYEIDLIRLLNQSTLGTNESNTYIIVNSATDLFGNSDNTYDIFPIDSIIVNQRPITLHSFDYIVDNTQPSIITINFYFSTMVDSSTFHCADYIFSSDPTRSPVSAIQLADTDCTLLSTTPLTHVVSVSIPSTRLSSLVSTTISNQNYIWLYTTSTPSLLYSTSTTGTLSSLPSTAAVRNGPQLMNYTINLNTGEIVLIFSKDVILGTDYNQSQIGFYSSRTQLSMQLDYNMSSILMSYLPISDPSVDPYTYESTLGVIQLSIDELNNIKAIDISASSLYITAGTEVVHDHEGTWLVPVSKTKKLIPARFLPDTIRPSLLSYKFNLGLNIITFVFDEPIRASSVIPTQITLYSIDNSTAASDVPIGNNTKATKYTLTGGTSFSTDTRVILTLTKFDASTIKSQTIIGQFNDTTYMTFPFTAFSDMSGNAVNALTTPLNATIVYPDTVGPDVLSFDLDLSLSVLILTFSEPVNPLTLDPTAITLQNRYYSRQGTYYTLTGGNVKSFTLYTVTIQLSDTDILNIRLTPGLCRSKASTYLTSTTQLVTDYLYNNVTEVKDTKALPCNIYTSDNMGPTIQELIYNANTNQLIFILDEIVQLGKVNIPLITFQLINSISPVSYTLTTNSDIDNSNNDFYSTTVIVNIGILDSNGLKSLYPLASSISMTWILLDPAVMTDVFENPLNSEQTLIQVTSYIKDITPPQLLTYVLDMSTRMVKLQFSKAVNSLSLQSDRIYIMNITNRRYASYVTFQDSSAIFGYSTQSNYMTVFLSDLTCNRISYYGIGKALTSSYLSFTNKFLTDYAGNYVPALWDISVLNGHPRVPTYFTEDMIPPTLLRWYVDSTTNIVSFYFSEPVTVNNITTISFYKDVNNVATLLSWTLQSTSLRYEEYNTRVLLTLDGTCSINDQTCSLSPILTQQLVYVTFPKNTFYDLSRLQNPINGVLRVDKFYATGPDCTPCSQGYHIQTPCTAHSDNICIPCTTCPAGSYTYELCRSDQDTLCMPCSTCPLGTYISETCSFFTDTVCTPCSTCTLLQYQISTCSGIQNTVCGTCEHCSFTDERLQKLCQESGDRYFWWAMDHCCIDHDNNQQPCSEVERQNILIAARDGRHHWAYPITTPPITDTAYAFGKDY